MTPRSALTHYPPRVRYSAALLLLASLTLACRSRAPVARPSPVPEPAAVPVDPLQRPWVLEWRATGHPRLITVAAELRSRIDTVARVDWLSSALTVALEASAGGGETFSVRVDDYRVRAGADTGWRVPRGLVLPATVAARARRGLVPAICTDNAGCSPELFAATQGWQELWLGDAPRVLVPGATWRDSSDLTVVRDSVPLAVTLVREFEVLDARAEGNAVVVRVQRRSTQVLRGEGRQFGEAVQLSGSGEGRVELEVRLPDGEIVSGRGSAMLAMQFSGRRRQQTLEQSSQITITAP